MTLETFALATRARIDMEDDSVLMRRVEMAAWVSDVLRISEDAQRLMPGAGLCLDGRWLFPTVLADRATIGGESDELLPVRQFPGLLDVLGSLAGGWPQGLAEDLRVLPVAEGELHAAPGSELLGARSGRMGPHVHWGSGQQGFLTAGHVAPSAGTSVTDTSGAALGSVLWANDPALAPSATGDLDAALVAFDPAHSATTGRASFVAGAGEVLTVAATNQQAAVLGLFGDVKLGAAQACYAQCYATETRITQRGDSGGLVEARGDVVGTVVGGFVKRDMTLVQAISYQLSEIRRRSGHMVSL